MHAQSETEEREMLTFTGNIKGQCSNCALQANYLPVPAICPQNRDEILIWHFFKTCFFNRNAETIKKKTGTDEAT